MLNTEMLLACGENTFVHCFCSIITALGSVYLRKTVHGRECVWMLNTEMLLLFGKSACEYCFCSIITALPQVYITKPDQRPHCVDMLRAKLLFLPRQHLVLYLFALIIPATVIEVIRETLVGIHKRIPCRPTTHLLSNAQRPDMGQT